MTSLQPPHHQVYYAYERLLAGPAPAPGCRFGSHELLEALLREGVSHFVDLTSAGESPDYGPLASQMARELGIAHPVHRLPRPLEEHGTPTFSVLNHLIDEVITLMDSGALVYVSCSWGVGRTGVVIGGILARLGVAAGDQLLELIDERRRHLSSPYKSPNVESQRAFVRALPLGRCARPISAAGRPCQPQSET